jgi:hypothetical protein
MIQLQTRVKETSNDQPLDGSNRGINYTYAGKMLYPGPQFSNNVHKASRSEYLHARTIHSSAPAKDELFGRTPDFRSRVFFHNVR